MGGAGGAGGGHFVVLHHLTLFVCELLTLFVCLLSGVTSPRKLFAPLPFLSSGVCLPDLPPRVRLCLLPLRRFVFFFGPPTHNSRFNSGFLVNHTWNLHRRLNVLPRRRVLPRSACAAQESGANYPGYWLLRHRRCDLHEVTFISNTQTFATLKKKNN